MMLTSDSSTEKSSPYFLSRLSSKSVPENGDVTFTCKITGNPKPKITWCRNGRDIKELEDFSSYEITDDNSVHTLHLFGCAEEQAGVYRIVASNCFGRVQSSAFLKVTSGAESEVCKTVHDNPKNNVRTSRANDITARHWESSNQAIENTEDLVEKNDSPRECFLPLGSSEPPAPEFNGLPSKQTTFSHPVECEICPPMENQHKNIHYMGDDICAKNALSPEANNGSFLDTTQNTSDLCIYESLEMSRECTEREMSRDCAEREVHTVNSSQVDSKPASQIDDHTNSCSLNAEDLAVCQTTEYAKTHEEICLSEVLRKEALSLSHIAAPLESQTCGLEDSYKNADNDFEILPGRTFTTADDASDNDSLEDLRCSNVTTEELCQEWERELKFLLESDDEDELMLGYDCDGCAYFLGEMPRLCQVSDNTMPMDATIGFCGHQSKSKEVAVRSGLAACNPSLLPTGMTLTVGQQQSKAPTTKDKEKYEQPVASMAIENDYPRIEEENNSNGQSNENSSVDGSRSMGNELLGMEPSSCGMSSSSSVTEKPNMERSSSRKNSQKFAKVREKVTKGRGKDNVIGAKKVSKCPLNKLHPKELHAAESCTIQGERSCLDSAAPLHGCNRSDPNEAYHQDTVKSSTHYGLLYGKEGDENSPQEGKWISSLSEGNQLPDENGSLMVRGIILTFNYRLLYPLA
ncbi:alpha-protein kinase 2 [Heteronotia binoei]|uniref:alpha-protein kinase 2 n=1 Tax=Heteronotia binoei TaxID=13085 RepID=UPI00292F4852|nr:alpha-protein kinase 2 [Heteronotia binoei]